MVKHTQTIVWVCLTILWNWRLKSWGWVTHRSLRIVSYWHKFHDSQVLPDLRFWIQNWFFMSDGHRTSYISTMKTQLGVLMGAASPPPPPSLWCLEAKLLEPFIAVVFKPAQTAYLWHVFTVDKLTVFLFFEFRSFIFKFECKNSIQDWLFYRLTDVV